jgi:formate dehydrogenase subunit gamma
VSTSRVISTRPRTVEVPAGHVLRYPFVERINHWLGSIAYVYALITGLAFWSPYLYWLASLVGGGPTARFWHPWAGVIFTISMLWMLQHWRPDMTTTNADRAWWARVSNYVRNQGDVPAVGRFNFGQKLLFWGMFYGAILLFLSGLVMWFVEGIPWSMRWLRFLAVAIHVAAAFVTIAGFIIHVYMSTAMVRGSFTAMVRGYVSEAWARSHHRLWYEEVVNRRPPQ